MRIRLGVALFTTLFSLLAGAPAGAATPAPAGGTPGAATRVPAGGPAGAATRAPAGGPAGAATPVPAGWPARVGGSAMLAMTFNLCGNVCRHGEVKVTASNIAYQIRGRRVAVAMLQELCYSQFVGVRDRLARYGYRATFATAATGGHCDDYDRRHGRAFGVGLIARGTLTGVVSHRLISPSAVRPEGRVVLGATVHLPGRTVFAVTTHTAPSGPNLVAQMNQINHWLTPIAARRPVLFGGDLNSMPDNPDLDGFYSSFTEANGDRANPLDTFITVPRKIDYLFGSRSYLNRLGAGTVCGTYSDHCMYLGRFQ